MIFLVKTQNFKYLPRFTCNSNLTWVTEIKTIITKLIKKAKLLIHNPPKTL